MGASIGVDYLKTTPVSGNAFLCTATVQDLSPTGTVNGPSATDSFSLYTPTSSGITDTTITEVPFVTLLQPNHNYRPVSLQDCIASAWDSCANAPLDVNRFGKILYVTSNQVENSIGIGSGNTCNDIVITSKSTMQLRAEREGNATDGRVYTIHFQVSDSSGTQWSPEQICLVAVDHSPTSTWTPTSGTCAYCVEGAAVGACGSCPQHNPAICPAASLKAR
jgi:hypothetical protein